MQNMTDKQRAAYLAQHAENVRGVQLQQEREDDARFQDGDPSKPYDPDTRYTFRAFDASGALIATETAQGTAAAVRVASAFPITARVEMTVTK